MKVIVDFANCLGHGQCAIVAPEVFRVDDDAKVEVLIEYPEEALRRKVQDAAFLCPERVIAIEE